MSDSVWNYAARGNFFQVDRRVWLVVSRLGLNEAVCYLVLARGTGRDNRTSAWSVHSIERYTGISRIRARAALDNLMANGLINQIAEGARPRYRLQAAHEGSQTRADMVGT